MTTRRDMLRTIGAAVAVAGLPLSVIRGESPIAGWMRTTPSRFVVSRKTLVNVGRQTMLDYDARGVPVRHSTRDPDLWDYLAHEYRDLSLPHVAQWRRENPTLPHPKYGSTRPGWIALAREREWTTVSTWEDLETSTVMVVFT